jgi:predicted MFS family arabinose efflux permease
MLSSRHAHFLFLCLVTAYSFSFFFRISASVVLPEQAERLGMSAALTGFISSLYYYAYSVMQSVAGALHDRFGPLRVVAGGMAVTAAGTLLLVLHPSPWTLGAWRLLTGFGLAPMYGGALVYQAAAFPPHRYAFYSSMTISIGALGAVVSVAPLGSALDSFGLSPTFAGLAAVSLSMAWILWRERSFDPVVRCSPFSEQKPQSIPSRLKEALGIIRNSPYLQALLVIWSTSAGALLSLQGLWAVSWYQTAYSVPPGTARNWASLISVGMFIGTALLGGFWGRAEDRFRGICFWSVFYGVSWAALWGSISLGLPLAVPGVCGLLIGATHGLVAVQAVSGVRDRVETSKTGALLGTMNMIVIFIAVLFQWGTGIIINFFPGERPGEFTPQGFFVCFLLVTVLILGSLAALFPLRRAGSGTGTGATSG